MGCEMGNSRICGLFAAMLVVAVMGMTGSASAQLPEEIAVGKPFPVLALPSAEDGEPMSVADFRGEKLVLHVFASW